MWSRSGQSYWAAATQARPFNMDMLAHAGRQFERAILLDSDDWESVMFLAMIRAEQGELECSAALFAHARELAPVPSRGRVDDHLAHYRALHPQGLGASASAERETTGLVGLWPNPANPTTAIAYRVAEPGHVRLQIFDVAGRLLKTLLDEPVEAASTREVIWDGRNDSGRTVASGVYFVRLQVDGVQHTNKLTLLQ